MKLTLTLAKLVRVICSIYIFFFCPLQFFHVAAIPAAAVFSSWQSPCAILHCPTFLEIQKENDWLREIMHILSRRLLIFLKL